MMDMDHDLNVDDPDAGDSKSLPWNAYNKYYSYDSVKDAKNFFAACKLCMPKKKLISCSFAASSNLKKHLENVHKLPPSEIDALAVVTAGAKRKKLESPGVSASTSSDALQFLKGGAGDFGGSSNQNIAPLFKRKPTVTQRDVDRSVMQLIIKQRLPFSIVSSTEFKALVMLGLPDHLKVECRQTISKRMDELYKGMIRKLKEELQSVEYLSTTADGWTKLRRGYLGMTVTWLDPQTLARKSAALALERLRGRHTSELLTAAICKVHNDFNIDKKVVRTVTDSGANFLKAFKDHERAPASTNEDEVLLDVVDSGSESNSDSDASVSPEARRTSASQDKTEDSRVIDIEGVLNEDVSESLSLPPHQRCGAHITNNLASKDGSQIIEGNAALNKISRSYELKRKQWIKKQNKSTNVAEILHKGFGEYLKSIVKTRWNSDYDSNHQIIRLMDQNEDAFHETIEEAGLEKLTQAEVRFAREYDWVMFPVAFGLDLLQREKNMYIGYLLPTVLSMEAALKERRQMNRRPLKYCLPLVDGLIKSIKTPRRFGLMLSDNDLILASCLVPRFKLDWLSSEEKKQEAREMLLREMQFLNWKSAGPDQDIQPDEVEAPTEEDPEAKFFGTSSKPSPPVAAAAAHDGAAAELGRYLDFSSQSVEECFAGGALCKFPRLRELFLKFNTPHPSSAAVERYFSLVGIVYSSLRGNLLDKSLKAQTMLNANFNYVNWNDCNV